MEDLIEALTIFKKYGNNDRNPVHCEHDVFYICDGIDDLDKISDDDKKRLVELGFFWNENDECFFSYRFGSC